ncbi:sensor histidine kinase [Oscillospiraceae bacterium HV4-5-C5C]|nr:sensor histidine kinase [Oscillospiraceae bacterium HV4-5-C5C]
MSGFNKNCSPLVKKLIDWFSNKSMRVKLLVSFSVPVVLIFAVLMTVIFIRLSGDYRRQIMSSSDKSYDQAYTVLDSYISTMVYASDKICYDGELQNTLSAVTFNGQRPYDIQFREFWDLDAIFSSAESNDIIYRAKIYIPDDIIYSSNTKHFDAVSKLEMREDYQDFVAASHNGLPYFTLPEAVSLQGETQTVQVVSLLRDVITTDGTNISLGVEQISIRQDLIDQVLEQSDITHSGFVYLLNNKKDLISYTDDATASKLSQSGIDLSLGADTGTWNQISLWDQSYFYRKQTLAAAGWMLVALLPEAEIYAQSKEIGLIIFFLSLLAIFLIVLISYALARFYVNRIDTLSKTMQRVQKGDLNLSLASSAQDEIGSLFDSFNYMTKQLRALMAERYRSGQALKAADLRALQAQINPHFLYNTLDWINWQALDHNAPEIAETTRNLAQFYRLSLNRGQQVTTIGDELILVKAYVNIQRHHLDQGLQLKIDADETVLNLACINLILQPFVENAIVHGISGPLGGHQLAIDIRVKRKADQVQFEIQDDGKGMTPQQVKQLAQEHKSDGGYGVYNVRSRLQLCFGAKALVAYQSQLGVGTRVLLTIPALDVQTCENIIKGYKLEND